MDLVWKIIGKKRFLNRKLRNFQPEILELNLSKEETLFVDPKDLFGPSFYVMFGGRAAFYHYEEPVKSAILEHLPRNGVFFDIGANIGLISLFVSKFRPDVDIVAFEPSRSTSRALKNTIEKNQIRNIQVEGVGVSDKSSLGVDLFIDSKSSGGNSLILSAISTGSKSKETIELTSLDDFIKKSNKIPSVVKVDVQDAESFVIQGAAELIAKYQPTFVIETNNTLLINNPAPFIQAFKGYEVYKVGTTKKVDIEFFPDLAKEYLKQNQSVLDYVFVKK